MIKQRERCRKYWAGSHSLRGEAVDPPHIPRHTNTYTHLPSPIPHTCVKHVDVAAAPHPPAGLPLLVHEDGIRACREQQQHVGPSIQRRTIRTLAPSLRSNILLNISQVRVPDACVINMHATGMNQVRIPSTGSLCPSPQCTLVASRPPPPTHTNTLPHPLTGVCKYVAVRRPHLPEVHDVDVGEVHVVARL